MGINFYSTTVEVEVDVDIDSDDLSDDDLREICTQRGIFSKGLTNDNDDIVLMWQAFRTGNTEKAMQLARKVAEDHVGLIV
jgi:hypothetical protein